MGGGKLYQYMHTTEITFLFDYSDWAGQRILRALLNVTPEQFTAPNNSSYGSLRGTLVHALFAATVWRRRMQGEPMPTGLPVAADFPTPQSLYDACLAEQAGMRAWLSGLSDDFLQSTFQYKTTKGVPCQDVVWHILMHLLNHNTQHRAEAAAMLTGFGCSPGDIDLIVYLREKGS